MLMTTKDSDELGKELLLLEHGFYDGEIENFSRTFYEEKIKEVDAKGVGGVCCSHLSPGAYGKIWICKKCIGHEWFKRKFKDILKGTELSKMSDF